VIRYAIRQSIHRAALPGCSILSAPRGRACMVTQSRDHGTQIKSGNATQPVPHASVSHVPPRSSSENRVRGLSRTQGLRRWTIVVGPFGAKSTNTKDAPASTKDSPPQKALRQHERDPALSARCEHKSSLRTLTPSRPIWFTRLWRRPPPSGFAGWTAKSRRAWPRGAWRDCLQGNLNRR